jgi:zinc protease
MNQFFIPRQKRPPCRTAWMAALAMGWVLMTGAIAATAEGRAMLEDSVVRDTLSNGLKVVIIRNAIAAVVTTVVNYHVGSNEAPKGFPGMAHAQEHMMFRGSPGLTAGQLANINAALGGMFNADTRQTVTQYFYTVAAEYLDVVLRIEAIRMSGANDSDHLWRQERGAIEQEVASDLSSPEYRLYTRLLSAMFKGTPYAHDALGTKASFDATSGAMLKKFFDTWYVPNNATLVIAGDVVPETVLSRVKELFASLPFRALPPRQEIRLESVKPETIRMDSDLPHNMASLSFRMPGCESPDYAASLILADVLDNRRGALYSLAAEGKVLEAGFELNPLPRCGFGSAEASFPQGTPPRKVIGMLRAVLSRLAANGVSSDLVEAAKRRETARAEFEKNSVYDLAMTWSEAVAVEGRHSPADLIDAIARVTVADVNRVARQCLDLKHMVAAILTSRPSGNPVMAKGHGAHETVSLPQSPKITLPSWADAALARPIVPRLNPGMTQKTLANGITLIVQPATISGTVSIYGHIKNNPALQVPIGQEGLAGVMEGLFEYGTESLDRQAFQKALDDIAADLSAGTDFSLEVLKEHFDSGTRLLADNLLHPAFPDTAFKIIRKQSAEAAAGSEQSPAELTQRALENALYPKKDPALRRPTRESVSALTLAEVRAYHEKVMRPDETIIVVIGEVSPAEAESVVVKYFGDWKAVGPKPDLLLPPVPANLSRVVHIPNKSRIQNEVILAGTMGLTRSDPDFYALELGNHVLGGGFYATRLYRELREEKGLVYTVEPDIEVDQRRAVYTVEYACDPANVEKVRDIVTRNITLMQTQPVAASELSLAKAMLLREIPLGESSLESIAQGFIHRIILDLPLDEPLRAARQYESLTAEAVQSAFAKWVKPRNWVRVTQGPSPR